MNMRRRLYILVFILLISSNLSVGKGRSSSKNAKGNHKNSDHRHLKTETQLERIKRSLYDEDDKPFWANRGKKQSEEDIFNGYGYGYHGYRTKNNIQKASEKIIKEPPFWGNRGRRDSSSVEDFLDTINFPKTKCQHCNEYFYTPLTHDKDYPMERRIDTPFWGNRGRRDSQEISEDDYESNISPVWDNRGRTQEDEPFWGNRGRREDDNPFWGNRGRRTRLSRFANWAQQDRDNVDPFWGNRGRRRYLKDYIENAMEQVEDNIINISRMKGTSSITRTSPLGNQRRDSVLKHLFTGAPRSKSELFQSIKKAKVTELEPQNDAKTVHNDRIFVDEPDYIIVERNSRSSGEINPSYFTRGQKELNYFELEKAARERRGAIEEIVKSVKTDPYFIVRGKKDFGESIINANASMHDEVSKSKDFVCATFDLILAKYAGAGKLKREVGENDRGRRATLKKLAAQLHIDPYFVSRGKKSGDRMARKENYEELVTQLSELCN